MSNISRQWQVRDGSVKVPLAVLTSRADWAVDLDDFAKSFKYSELQRPQKGISKTLIRLHLEEEKSGQYEVREKHMGPQQKCPGGERLHIVGLDDMGESGRGSECFQFELRGVVNSLKFNV
ncbi:hypothetical protein TNIN_102201 [Trichonephila inaurata madagascariensis]|uniref:Uncharacterized protein n=1 Tax=Trichonephila inaurata madagascariensis TaxID=2747483 RepID=A0A8X6XAT4_9ARAC|nr:hypothetical protein TNIN_102201 [Trichonephila inaurata madagascariensis]